MLPNTKLPLALGRLLLLIPVVLSTNAADDDEQSLIGLRSVSKPANKGFPMIPGLIPGKPDDHHDEEPLCKRVDKLEVEISTTQQIAIENKQQIELINKNINSIQNDIANTNRNLNKQVSELENKISMSQSSVQSQISEIKNQISQSQRSTQDQISDLRNEMRTSQSSAQDQISKLKNSVAASTQSANSQDQGNSVNVEVSQASHDITHFHAQLQSMQSQISQQTTTLSVEVRQLQTQMASLNAVVFAPSGGDSNGNQIQIAKQATNVQQSVDVSQLQSQIAELEAQMRSFQRQSSEQTVTATLRSDVTQIQTDIVEINNKLESLQTQINQLSGPTGVQLLLNPLQRATKDLATRLAAVEAGLDPSAPRPADQPPALVQTEDAKPGKKAEKEEDGSSDGSLEVEVRALQQDMVVVKAELNALMMLTSYESSDSAVEALRQKIQQTAEATPPTPPSALQREEGGAGAALELEQLALEIATKRRQERGQLKNEVAQLQATLAALLTPPAAAPAAGGAAPAAASSRGSVPAGAAFVEAQASQPATTQAPQVRRVTFAPLPTTKAATTTPPAAAAIHATVNPPAAPVTIAPGIMPTFTIPPGTTTPPPTKPPVPPPCWPCPYPPCPPPPCPYPPCPPPCPPPPCPFPPCPLPCGGGFNGDININVTVPGWYWPAYPPFPGPAGAEVGKNVMPAPANPYASAATTQKYTTQKYTTQKYTTQKYTTQKYTTTATTHPLFTDAPTTMKATTTQTPSPYTLAPTMMQVPGQTGRQPQQLAQLSEESAARQRQAVDPYCAAFAGRMVDTKWLELLQSTASNNCKKAMLDMRSVELGAPAWPPCAKSGYEARLKQLQSAYPGCPPTPP